MTSSSWNVRFKTLSLQRGRVLTGQFRHFGDVCCDRHTLSSLHPHSHFCTVVSSGPPMPKLSERQSQPNGAKSRVQLPIRACLEQETHKNDALI